MAFKCENGEDFKNIIILSLHKLRENSRSVPKSEVLIHVRPKFRPTVNDGLCKGNSPQHMALYCTVPPFWSPETPIDKHVVLYHISYVYIYIYIHTYIHTYHT